MDRSWYRIALRGVSRASLTRTLLPFPVALGVLLSSSPVMAQSVCNTTGGVAPVATGGSSFACGDTATASGNAAVAFGTQANASGQNSTALGLLAASTNEYTTAVGRSAAASGYASSAIGYNATTTGNDSLAVGGDSSAAGANGTALGRFASAAAQNSTSVGSGASASASNSVALGANSVADQDNTVSVGAAGAERRVTNVAAGTGDTDAVNVSQLKDSAATTLAAANTYTDQQADATLTAANTYTDQQINQVGNMANSANAALAQFRSEVDDRFEGIDARLDAMDDSLRHLDQRISRQAAMTAAMVQSSATPDVGDNFLGVGVGGSDGQNAVAATFRRRFTQHFIGSVGAARSSGESSWGAGVGVTW